MQTYKEQLEEIKAEQKDMSPEELHQKLVKENEYVLDLNKIPEQGHHWVDRGTVMSCEGGNHPFHQAFKRR